MKNAIHLKIDFHQPEHILLLIGSIIGLLFCIFIPYGAGFDESAHLIRIFDIANLNIIPQKNPDPTLAQFYMYSYQRHDFQSPAFDQFSKRTFFSKPVWDHTTAGTNNSPYFPLNYVFQSILALIMWKGLNFPILPGIILIRMAEFAFYLCACYQTVKLLPFGKWIFLVLALSPMALFQAATINIDGITNALSYLFVGYLLKVISEKEIPIDRKRTWGIVILTILIGCVKPATFFLLALLLFLLNHKFASKKYKYLIAAGALLSVVISVGWSYIVVINMPRGSDVTFMDEVRMVFQNLPDFLLIYARGIILSLRTYYFDCVGVYGYWVGRVPSVTYILYPLALILAFFSEIKKSSIPFKNRILIFVIGLICLLGIASFKFVYGYTPGVQRLGAQGRYFLPFLPVAYLAFAGTVAFPASLRRICKLFAVAALTAMIAFYSFGLFRTYYTNCVYGVSADQVCTLPVYKNVDTVQRYVTQITAKTNVSQSFTAECSVLSSVQVYVESSAGQAADKVQFNLLDASQKQIASQNYSLSGLKKGDFLVLPIKLKAAPGKTQLWLSLSLLPGDSSNAALDIFGRKGSDKYPDGELLLNGKSRDGDLYFQYTCTSE
jgi:uncharacterized membrane protein